MRKISEISVSVDVAVTVWFFVYFLAVCVGSMYSVDDHKQYRLWGGHGHAPR